MKLLALGASGRVGQWLVRLAAERGHEVTALARPTAKLDPPSSVRALRGNIADPAVLQLAVQGQDAVASCIGIRRSGVSPWAALRSPPDLAESVTRILVSTMQHAGVQRLVAISAGGVGDSVSQLTRLVRWVVTRGNIGVAYEDLARMESVLRASTLDWLAVRPVTLVNGALTRRARPVARFTAMSTVRRSDVAAWMLDALERREPFSERLVLLGTG